MLKHGDLFAVFDRRGDAIAFETGSHGLYYQGTRFLSGLALRIDGERPLLLGSTVRDDNSLLTVDLANPAQETDGVVTMAGDTVHLFRSRFVYDNTCHEKLRVTNHGMDPCEVLVSVHVAADYADIFEVRGAKRERRGEMLEPWCSSDASLTLGYRGLDGETRTTVVDCSPVPAKLTTSEISYRVALDSKEDMEIHLTITCLLGENLTVVVRPPHDEAFEKTCVYLDSARARECRVRTSNELFNDWIARSSADLHMMVTETNHGPYPYAGVPWFNTIFGRDGLITAREVLWTNPSIAKGVLSCLAATQASVASDSRDAEPGKIVHELRDGEMAALGEIPFRRYYGSVDSTPLFVMLAHDYWVRTADRATIETIWPAIERGLEWIRLHGDYDGDGFLEYQRRAPNGLLQQGWKDSDDSIFHADGSMAEGPVALSEVQAYAYAARLAGAELASVLGKPEAFSAVLRSEAAELKERFDAQFWDEDLGTYALALDGEKKACRVRSSNAGHCLFAGIAEPSQAARIAEGLMAQDSFSGWGVRTLSSLERRYNPMSYHNGSIWPHDNAVVAAGMSRYGMREPVLKVLEAQFHASLFMELHRMPELFCGFQRRAAEGPTLYPVACAPQAWAAGAVFLLLEACLGMVIDARRSRIAFHQPALPDALDWIEIDGLVIGDASVDLLLRRARSDVAIEMCDKRGDATVEITKRA